VWCKHSGWQLNGSVFPGPGLAIRVICAEEPYMEKDFAETGIMLRIIVDFANAIKKVSSVGDDDL